jgi:peptidase E/ribosomal protein S18 acetylase RimI-like enzyme
MTGRPRQIVAMGGGGFSMEPDNLLLDEYVLSLAASPKPRVCFLPTASSDAAGYVQRFHNSFRRLTRRTTQLKLTPPDKRDIRAHLLAQDVIYVGGGNTMRMLQTWRQYRVDEYLREAYESGVVLAGISAGSICWFEWALTDSIPGKLTVLPGLEVLKGSNCVHYDGEPERRPAYRAAVAAGRSGGHAADDGVALHYVDEALHRVVSSRPAARAWRVTAQDGHAQEAEIVPHYLGRAMAARFPVIRRASLDDAPAIHAAHHRSVREIASRDYTPEQIAAWSSRPFDAEAKENLVYQIREELVWVIEWQGHVEGYAHLRYPRGTPGAGYLHALYLTPEVAGRGLAKRLMALVEDATRGFGRSRLTLHSSRTALRFYERLGYKSVGPAQVHVVKGVALPCVPMAKDLSTP